MSRDDHMSAFAEEHKKGQRKSTYDKHTKPRPGRLNEKKRNSKTWTPKPRRKPK